MILRFPNLETFQLVLTSGLISEQTQGSPVRFADAPDGFLLVEPTGSIDRASMAEMKQLGVEKKRSEKADYRTLSTWHEALPLAAVRLTSVGILGSDGRVEPAQEGHSLGDKTEVLFELKRHDTVSNVVAEMLRLGNDRQSFRYVGNNGSTTALLRVTGPPYYTMLRALEGNDQDFCAYVQQSPRVWVQVGFEHPFGDRIQPSPGQWLLIKQDSPWQYLDEGAFRDVFELLEFKLPGVPTGFEEQSPDGRFEVRLSLTKIGSRDAPEMWVLCEDALEQTEKLVRSVDDRLISRLAFAVAQDPEINEGNPVVLIRARPSRLSPPVLVLDGTACAPYLKIPNLFVPIGRRVHPPLRRDTIHQLLAKEGDKITWLLPSEGDSFTTHSIADAAFRPLDDWVDYVLDHEHVALQAWVDAHRFDFESFVCTEDAEKKKPAPPKKPKEKLDDDRQDDSPTSVPKVKVKRKRPKAAENDPDLDFANPDAVKPKQQALQLRLRELEAAFQESEEPLDAPSRVSLWKEMGLTNAALAHQHDTTVCWANALWDSAGSDDSSDIGKWLRCEQHCAGMETFNSAVLDQLLHSEGGHAARPSLVATYLIWIAGQETTPQAVKDRQSELTQYLRNHECFLPIRAAWMAWCALYELSGKDELLLARARDRMLERLFSQGLAPEFDMAGFMRTGGTHQADRFRALRSKLVELREMVRKWIEEPIAANHPQTGGYAELMFAYALARLGETAECNEMLDELSNRLVGKDAIHRWVYLAFRHRIKRALAGATAQESLPTDLLDQLESMDKMDRYKLDKMRHRSHILEPHIRIDPYRNWHQRYPDDLSREMAALQNTMSQDELRTSIRQIMKHPERTRWLPSVLQVAPRVEEGFACEVLELVDPAIRKSEDAIEKALVLQQALFVSAHYGRIDFVQSFMKSLIESLSGIVGDYLSLPFVNENVDKIHTIESLFTQSFRGLRKLGMREEIGKLYGLVADLVEEHEPKGKTKRRRKNSGTEGDSARPQRLLLCVAGGWFYFGQHERARAVADRVRNILFKGDLPNIEQKNLTCAYLHCVAQAPVDEAIKRVQELFTVSKRGERKLPRIGDNMTTSTHFSISQLDVVESAVLSLVSDDFSLNSEARRWLDEDEFLVRTRIHRDVRVAIGH